jgi:glucokinase
MKDKRIIGIDLGATNIRGALVTGDSISGIVSARIHSDGTVEEVLNDIYQVADALAGEDVAAIGIGVPSVVDVAEGIVYDVQYIPSWVQVPLKRHLENRYRLPVFVNNDANCFALGEYHFGKGRGEASLVGLTLGTGLGGGVIINHKLFPGFNCGAGEFGLLPYKDAILEYYASGSFFKNLYGLEGVHVFEAAKRGERHALECYL